MAVLGALGALGAPRSAGADLTSPPRHSLGDALHTEDTACLQHDELARYVAHWMASDSVDARLRVTVREDGEAYTYVVMNGATVTGNRRLPPLAGTCVERMTGLGLAIAIALDAAVLQSLGVPTAAPTAAMAPTLPLTGERRGAANPEHFSRLSVSAGFLALVNVLPTPTVGAMLGVDVALGRVVDLRAESLYAGGSSYPLGSGHADTQVLAGSLLLCAGAPLARARGRLCAGAEGGAWFAQGNGYALSFQRSPAWVSAVLRADVGVPFSSSWSLALGAEGYTALIRPRLGASSASGTIVASYSAPRFGLALDVGPLFAF